MRIHLKARAREGSLARISFGALLPIVSAGPEGSGNRFGRPFDEGLAHEGGASQPPVDPMLLTAALGDWRDARIFLKLRGACVALPLFTEGNKQSRSEHCAGPWESAKERIVRQGLTDRTDLSIEARDGVESHAQLFDERLN